jgi:hypothetical protein
MRAVQRSSGVVHRPDLRKHGVDQGAVVHVDKTAGQRGGPPVPYRRGVVNHTPPHPLRYGGAGLSREPPAFWFRSRSRTKRNGRG